MQGHPNEGGQTWDDTYLWPTSLPRLQSKDLEQRLGTHGVQIQPDKTQFIESHEGAQPSTVQLGNTIVQARPPSTPISVFNQPVSFQNNESHLAEHLVTKARIAFHKQSHILTSSARLIAKLKLIATTITTSALWGCESGHYTIFSSRRPTSAIQDSATSAKSNKHA